MRGVDRLPGRHPDAGSLAVGESTRHPCPACGRLIASTSPFPYAGYREGRAFHYVYLRQHHDTHGTPCSGNHALVDPPTQTHPRPCSPNERTPTP